MQRMTALDAQFLDRDAPEAPRQIASLAILEPGDDPLDYDRLIKVILERIDLVPRYRQIPRRLPGGVGLPVWVDDEHFDISLHVRRSALPRPGSPEALHELVARLIARRLDHDRPLWELYLIEGLGSGQTALLFKAHQALVDGSHTVDLAQVLLEETDRARDIPHEDWTPRPHPTTAELVLATLLESARSPVSLATNVAYQAEKLSTLVEIPGVTGDPEPHDALSAELTRNRRFATIDIELDAFRRVRDEHGGTVNDVILASIAGGLRAWLLTRAEPLTAKTSFRAMVPMSVMADEDGETLPTSLGSRVRGHLVALPVGEPNPVVRLHQVSYALKDHRETGSAVAANKLASLPGFSTSTFHAVGARVADDQRRRPFHLTITNVPGPQDPMFMAGQRLSEVYAAIPLSGSRPLSIGVTSYSGHVYFGIVADREAVPDVDILAQCVRGAVDELLETVGGRKRAPHGRTRPKKA